MTTTTKRPDGGEHRDIYGRTPREHLLFMTNAALGEMRPTDDALMLEDRLKMLGVVLQLASTNESPAPQADALDRVIEETGSRDAEDLADMANVGHSLMRSIEVVVKNEGPFKGWSPAQDPAEIVLDLCNALDEALAPQPPVEGLREATLACADDLIAVCEAASRAAKRTGNTFVLDRQRVAGFIHGRLAALASPSLTAGASSELRRVWLDRLNAIAPAVENLACHQEQCDFDGVMVKVSRQALDEVLNAVNDLAVSFVTAPATLIEQSGQKDFEP